MSDEKRPIKTRKSPYAGDDEGASIVGGAETPRPHVADRRVPTAADVEQGLTRWEYWPPKWRPIEVKLVVADGQVMARNYGSPLAPLTEMHGTWLGPVNPEPLPRPEDGR